MRKRVVTYGVGTGRPRSRADSHSGWAGCTYHRSDTVSGTQLKSETMQRIIGMGAQKRTTGRQAEKHTPGTERVRQRETATATERQTGGQRERESLSLLKTALPFVNQVKRVNNQFRFSLTPTLFELLKKKKEIGKQISQVLKALSKSQERLASFLTVTKCSWDSNPTESTTSAQICYYKSYLPYKGVLG